MPRSQTQKGRFPGNTLWVVAALLWLAGCNSFKPTQPPDLILEGVHDVSARSIAFDPTGALLASGGADGAVHVWSVGSGTMVQTLMVNQAKVVDLAWTLSHGLIVGCQDGRIHLFDARGNHAVVQREGRLKSMAVLEQRNRIYAAFTDGLLVAYALDSLAKVGELRLGSPPSCIAASPSVARIAVALEAGKTMLLDDGLKPVRSLPDSPHRLSEMRFSPRGDILAAGAWFKLVVWDLTSGNQSIVKSGHHGKVASVDFSPDGRWLASIGRIIDSSILIMAVDSKTVQRRLAGHRMCGTRVRFDPTGRWLATASDDLTIRLFDLTAPYRPERQPVQLGPVFD